MKPFSISEILRKISMTIPVLPWQVPYVTLTETLL